MVTYYYSYMYFRLRFTHKMNENCHNNLTPEKSFDDYVSSYSEELLRKAKDQTFKELKPKPKLKPKPNQPCVTDNKADTNNKEFLDGLLGLS